MWWELRYSGSLQEEVINLLWILGAEGIVEEPSTVTAYFQGDQHTISKLDSSVSGIAEPDSISVTKVEKENWTQSCQELLATVVLGELTIIPVQSADVAPPPEERTVVIIPGMGFGTGHHETTSSVIHLLQHKGICNPRAPERIMDFGTGSGILAIGAQKLFPSATIWANDIDEDALQNARENSEINGLTEIIFFNDEVQSVNQTFDLLIANVYAEVLCQFEGTFYDCLASQGKLILSGIMTPLLPTIKESFIAERWRELEFVQLGNWSSFLLSKR